MNLSDNKGGVKVKIIRKIVNIGLNNGGGWVHIITVLHILEDTQRH